MKKNDQDVYPIGYKALVEQFKLSTIKHFRWSYISMQSARRTHNADGVAIYLYDKSYALAADATPLDHIAFALKHEGINLEIIKAVFDYIQLSDVEKYIQLTPTGKYARMIWFLYESITRKMLSLPPITTGSYVNLLDAKKYFTAQPIKHQRYRIYDNMLGNFAWCPFIRRTQTIAQFEQKKLNKKSQHILEKYSYVIQERANTYLYIKETRSSYALEYEKPSVSRTQQFVKLLSNANKIKHLTKQILVELQNYIVDSRFANKNYRSTQNYIGQQAALDYQIIHYISPKPADVPALMHGLLESLDRMLASDITPVVMATAISFGFVYIHPFDDGNGRLHRFLIHYILCITGFTPSGTIIPISATMLNDRQAYDKALENFSKPLLEVLTGYEIDKVGKIAVQQSTADYYRYIDYTPQVEFLFACLETTISIELPAELLFLDNYDKARNKLQNIVDMPNEKLDLFIKLTLQNQGHLAVTKRKKFFDMLSDQEVLSMERVLQKLLPYVTASD